MPQNSLTCPNASTRTLANSIAQVKPALRSLGLENRATIAQLIVAQLSELRERRIPSTGAIKFSNVPQRFHWTIGRLDRAGETRASLPRFGKPSDYRSAHSRSALRAERAKDTIHRCLKILQRAPTLLLGHWRIVSHRRNPRFAPSVWKNRATIFQTCPNASTGTLADWIAQVKPALRSLGLENRATIFPTCPDASARTLAEWIAQVNPALRSLGLENRATIWKTERLWTITHYCVFALMDRPALTNSSRSILRSPLLSKRWNE